MEIKNIIIASAVVAIVGLIIAILLSVAEKIFHVEVDEKEIKSGRHLQVIIAVLAAMQDVTRWQKQLPKAKHRLMPAHLQVSQVLIKLLKLWVHKPVIM